MGSEAASTPFFKQGLKQVIEAGHLRFVAVDEEYRPRIDPAIADEVVDDLEEERRLARTAHSRQDDDLGGLEVLLYLRKVVLPPDAGFEGFIVPPGVERDQEIEDRGLTFCWVIAQQKCLFLSGYNPINVAAGNGDRITSPANDVAFALQVCPGRCIF